MANHKWQILCLVAALFAAPPLPAADVVDRLSGAPAAPDYNFARARVQQLESQIASLIAAQNRSGDGFTASAIRADINLRIIARSLLSTGIAAGPDGAVAVLYGHTLADHADTVQQQLLSRLPALVTRVKDLNQQINPADIETALKLETAVDRFNAAAEKASESLKSPAARDVDAYMQSMLAPLAAMLKLTENKEPVSTWLTASTAVKSGGPASSRAAAAIVTPELLEDVSRRIQSAPLPQATRADLLELLGFMQRGLSQPDLRPRIAMFYDQLEMALIVAEDLEAVTWLGPRIATQFVAQLETAIQLLKDPRTRDSAVLRLDTMVRSLGLARELSQLHDDGLPTDHLRTLFLRAHQLRLENQDTRTADALLGFIDRFNASALEYRRLLADTAPPSFRPILVQLRGEYQKAELKLVAGLGELATNITLISDGKWQAALEDLTARLSQMQRVHRIPAWIEQLTQHKPRPTGGLMRELRQLAVDLLDPERRAAAAGRLAALESQIAAFDPMRFEKELAAPTDLVRQATDESYTLLLEQIERLRQEWATAWASGTDETATVERLAQMARLLRAIELATELSDLAAAATRLNAWAGWQADPAAMTSVIDALPQRVQQASRFAAISNWPALTDALNQLETEVPVPMLVVTLKRRLSPGLERLPSGGGAQGVLSQALYPPREGAFAAEHRLKLAQISVYLLEAAHARAGRSEEQAKLAEAFVAQTAKNVLAEIREQNN